MDVAVEEAVKALPQRRLMQSPLPGMQCPINNLQCLWSLMSSHRASLGGLRCSLRIHAGDAHEGRTCGGAGSAFLVRSATCVWRGDLHAAAAVYALGFGDALGLGFGLGSQALRHAGHLTTPSQQASLIVSQQLQLPLSG